MTRVRDVVSTFETPVSIDDARLRIINCEIAAGDIADLVSELQSIADRSTRNADELPADDFYLIVNRIRRLKKVSHVRQGERAFLRFWIQNEEQRIATEKRYNIDISMVSQSAIMRAHKAIKANSLNPHNPNHSNMLLDYVYRLICELQKQHRVVFSEGEHLIVSAVQDYIESITIEVPLTRRH